MQPADTIEAAVPADIPALCGMLALLFAQETDFRPDAVRQERALREIIADPRTGRLLVCREHGTVVGMVSLLFTVSTAEGGRAALLEDLVVAPAARGRGLGSRLLDAALALAGAEGCLRVTVLTDHDNQRALALYGKSGFTASGMRVLRRHLAAAGGEAGSTG